MRRRKFILGVGSMAVGSAAAIGTGALDASEVDRSVSGRIVSDVNPAYLKISPRSPYAEVRNGQLTLSFDDLGDNGSQQDSGNGLNADSINEFDEVFKIDNRAEPDPENDLHVWIEHNIPHLQFYWSGRPYNQSTNYPQSELATSGNKAEIVPQGVSGNNGVKVGVIVDVDDIDRPQEVFRGNDEFTIHADRS